MTIIEAIEIMCKRCSLHEMCQGSGCEPKKTLIMADEWIKYENEHRKKVGMQDGE